VSTAGEPSQGQEGTWLQGHDILPSNIPGAKAAETLLQNQPVAVVEPPKRRRRRWSVIVGLPVVAILFLAIGLVAGHYFLASPAQLSASGGGQVHTMTNVGGDPLVSAAVDASPQIPIAPVHFLEAQAKGDGQAMWNLLSPAAQAQLSSQGGSADALTKGLQGGPLPTVKQITFAGGSQMSDGRWATIYILTADLNGQIRQVPYYFTVNTDGKIDEFH